MEEQPGPSPSVSDPEINSLLQSMINKTSQDESSPEKKAINNLKNVLSRADETAAASSPLSGKKITAEDPKPPVSFVPKALSGADIFSSGPVQELDALIQAYRKKA